MYNSTNTAERIKLVAKKKKIVIKDMLSDCELNKNTLSSMQARGSWLQANSLAKIADYLDCSVDYLLGRETSQHFNVENTGDNVGVVGQSNAPVTIHGAKEYNLTTQERDLLRIYKNANTRQQIKLMDYALSIEEEMNEE